MSDTDAKQIERMNGLLKAQKAAFAGERHRPLDKRIEDIDRVAELCRRFKDRIAEAIAADFGTRPVQESLIAEVAFVIQDAAHTKKHLRKWAKDKRVSVPLTLMPGKAYIRREPKGVVGIVSPWNYPFQLAMAPLVAALGAGCRAMIKPSEYTPATAELMKMMIGEAFAEDHVSVVTGGPAVGEAFCKLKWDHLFYTGSTQVGRLVALAAADNLVPVTLELGGKSPAILCPDAEIEKAVNPIVWGKFFNAGQTCVAPDYVMTPKGKERAFAEAAVARAGEQFADPSQSPDYASIVSDRHYDRLTGLIDEAREAGADILQPEHDSQAAQAARKIPPTIILNPPMDGRLMSEEIFGPLLPVFGYAELDQASRFVSERDHPLALYVFAKDKAKARRVLDGTLSGGAGVNNTILHLSIADLPFGGVGASGQGAYHGEAGFRTFTHERSVFETGGWHPSKFMAPPYGKFAASLIKRQLG